jgi:2-dehydro-3-deoxyphosphogluconate aldolase / (4S)-4-hydroxy-2-oxoglutarate aldolase
MNIEIKKLIGEYKIIAIVRKIYGENLIKLAQALYAGGIKMLEITFDQADTDCIDKTSNAIALIANEMNGKMMLGAGTVLSVTQVDAANAGGAKYIVSPNTDEKVIRYSKQKGLVSIPGAMTPSEMVNAINFGADFVKVFPVSDLGLKYMKSVMSPLNHIKFIATGGVSLDNLADMLNTGFVAAGIGGYLADKKLIANGDFGELTNRASKFVEISKNYSTNK